MNQAPNIDFKPRVKPVKHRVALKAPERRAYLFRDVLPPSEWAEKHFKLDGGYAESGKLSFKGREWQREIVDSITRYKEIYLVAPTRSGKSLLWHIIWAWFVDTVCANTLIVFADNDTVEGVFEERLKPSVKGTLSHLWTGREDDIRRDKIMVGGNITRTASCRVESDLSTFGSSLTIGDEVAKWKGNFDAVNMTRGRREDYKGLPGYHDRSIWASSPKYEGDPLHNEINKGGVVHFHYEMPCPHCYEYHELLDQYIEELPNDDGEKDHNPLRIKTTNAAAYLCPRCKQRIEDVDRYDMIPAGMWIADNETVDRHGHILNRNPLRDTAEEASYTWNRLILPPEKYSFAVCLSAFHAARTASDPRALEIYQNEHMARFINQATNKISQTYLATKISAGVNEYTTESLIPDGIIAAVIGVDTQDAGFYYTIVGYGSYMESWVLRYGWIECDMRDVAYKDNPEAVCKKVEGVLYGNSNDLVKGTGEILPVIGGFVDEGGHRERDVQFLCRKHPELMAYKGKSSSIKNGLMIERSKSKRLWLGATERLSKIIESDIESDSWHLPSDVDDEFLKQAINQTWEKKVDIHGNTKTTFVSRDPDHYRDCLNYARGAAEWHNLPVLLRNSDGIARIQNAISNKVADDARKERNINKPKEVKPQTPFTPRRRLWSRG